MANTEGLTDEEMLRSVNETVMRDWSSATASSSGTTRRLSSRLAERLDTPLGEGGPSAKMIRASRPPAVKILKPKGKKHSARSNHDDNNSKPTTATAGESKQHQHQHDDNATDKQPPLVLGEIVERKRRGKGQRRAKSAVRATPTQGFPSLKKPLGTFTPESSATRKSAHPTSKNASNARKMTTTNSNDATANFLPSSSVDTLKQASAKDADRMLASMSADEIRQSAQELQGLLSADTLAFLRNRNKDKQPRTLSRQPNHEEEKQEVKESPVDTIEQERREKERLAQLLSSVRTYEQMDAVYQAEVGETPELIKEDPSSDPFAVACDLLRSTVPRQNLLAVRTVRDRLAKDYRDGKAVRLPDNQQAWPYPTILPVSLRCLLDQAPNRVNGFALHTYALESLYLLLRLRCVIEHDTDLSSADDPTAVYHLIFGEDAIPSPPLSSAYKSSIVADPLSVGQHENVAYATASSSATATKDGQKFAQDPLWTLLSQMRIIPRLASLFESFRDSSCQDGAPDVPEEAWLASLGILSMVAQRSPGAATAMVQHKTLLKDIAHIAWDEVDAPVNIVLSTMRLWTILARQGRTAAAGLDLPPWGMLLGVKKAYEKGRLLQQWTLVLWRILLSYGLHAHELEGMLTLAANHVTILNTESRLAPLYLSCFSLILKIHHEKVINAVDDTTADHAIRQMVKVRSWLQTCYRQCLSYLSKAPETPPTTENLILIASCMRFCQQHILTAEDASPNPPGEYKSNESTADDEIACIKSLQVLTDAGIVSSRLALVAPMLFANESNESKNTEAATARLLTDFASTLRMLQRRLDDHSLGATAQEYLASVSSLFSEILVGLAECEAGRRPDTPPPRETLVEVGWCNRSRFVFVELLRLVRVEKKIEPTICVAMGVNTLASMQVGDEALVDRLLRMDVICLPLDLRSAILGQLWSSGQKQLQIKHSASLNRSYFRDQAGTDDLQSLRVEADNSGPRHDDADSSVLPLGRHWLLNVLAGSASSNTPTERIAQVLCSTLSILNDLEGAGSKGICRYIETLQNGSKMYFLMNVCMQSEDVLAVKDIEALCSCLRLKYLQNVDSSFVESFADSCVAHASVQLLGSSARDESEEANPESDEEKKLANVLLEEREDPESILSGKRLRIVMDFVNDLCNSFCDYGAQYPFFGTCFRAFLCPSFPSQIRCEVLRRLQGLLHLLSSPEEDENPFVLARLLADPQADGATLDTLASCFSRSSPSRAPGLVENLAVASLGMSLSESARKGSLNLQQRRLDPLQPLVLGRVAKAAKFCLKQDSGRLELSKFVLDSNSELQMMWDDVACFVLGNDVKLVSARSLGSELDEKN